MKVEFKDIKTAKASKAVTTKRVRDAAGKLVNILTLNADSATFADDLTYAFGRNVAKARRRNKPAGKLVPSKG
jgi:hypothetical protein